MSNFKYEFLAALFYTSTLFIGLLFSNQVLAAVPLISGLGGASGFGNLALSKNDDGSSGLLFLGNGFPDGVNFFGSSYDGFYVNNNGNITFSGPVSGYTPISFPIANLPMIAPFWGDVDTRSGTLDPNLNNVYISYALPGKVVVTWNYVGYYAGRTNKLNAFQLILTNRSDTGVGDFNVEFRYEQIEWTTGAASGGVNGLGGVPAQVGFDAGDRTNFYKHPDSLTGNIVNIPNTSNVNEPGRWLFQVRGGIVAPVQNIMNNVQVTLTIPSSGLSIDNYSFSIPPVSITKIADSFEIKWFFETFQMGQIEDLNFNAILINPLPGEIRNVSRTLELTYQDVNGVPVQMRLGEKNINVLPSVFELSTATDKQEYFANNIVTITSPVINRGEFSASTSVHTKIVDALGNTVFTLPPKTIVALPAAGTLLLSYSWDTKLTAAGQYKVIASIVNQYGIEETKQEAVFNIKSAQATVCSITTDKQVYHAWDQIGVTARIQNASVNAIQPATDIDIALLNSGGVRIQGYSMSIEELQSEAFRDLLHSYTIVDAAPGAYQLFLTVKDAYSQDIISSATTSILVTRNDAQGLTGSTVTPLSQVYKGNQFTCVDEIQNISSTNLLGVIIHRQFIEVDTGLIVNESSTVVDLYANSKVALIERGFDSSILHRTGYACLLKVDLKGVRYDLSFAGIEIINNPPIAHLGMDFYANINTPVTIDGYASSDVDGDALSYQWRIIRAPLGSAKILQSPYLANPNFIADIKGTYVLQLVVSDGIATSAPALITITVLNHPPVAADDLITVDEDGAVTIAMLANDQDIDGDPLSLSSVSTVAHGSVLSHPDNTVTYTPDTNYNGADHFIYQISDGDGGTATANVSITVRAVNDMPVADAGMDQYAYVDDLITFNGGNSFDIDGDSLSYHWRIVSVPSASSTILMAATTATPWLTPDQQGDYRVELIVNDDTIDSIPTTVLLHVPNRIPTAMITADTYAYVDDLVLLDGSGSFDSDHDSLSYFWVLQTPLGSASQLSDPYAVAPTFIVDYKGVYQPHLYVHDGIDASPLVTAAIKIPNRVPIASAGVNQTVYYCDLVTVSGAGSFDPDHDPISWHWHLGKPVDSTIGLLDNYGSSTHFIPDVAGAYITELTVHDGIESSQPTSSVVTAITPPVDLYTQLHQSSEYRMLVLLPSSKASRKHGHEHRQGINDQRQIIEAELAHRGWMVTVVTDSDAFGRELRSGGYGLYGIFASSLKSDQLTELSAAVYRGEGVIFASADGAGDFATTLGVRSASGQRSYEVDLLASPLADAQRLTFVRQLDVAPVRVEGASVIGWVVQMDQGEHDHEYSGGNSVITSYQFGKGKVLYVGFDLLTSIADNPGGALGGLLHNALIAVQPSQSSRAGAVIPLTLELRNLACVATATRLTLTLPPEVTLIDSGGGAVQRDGSLVRELPLIIDGAASWRFWLHLPQQTGPLTLSVVVEAGYSPSQLQPFDSAQITLNMPMATTLTGALQQATDAASSRSVSKAVDKAVEAQRKGHAQQLMDALLKAFDQALGSEDHGVDAAAMPLSLAVRAAAMQRSQEQDRDQQKNQEEGKRHE